MSATGDSETGPDRGPDAPARASLAALPALLPVLAVVFAASSPTLPEPRAPGAKGFSGVRAAGDLAVFAGAPRPARSPGNAAAREWIAARLRAAGLEVSPHRTPDGLVNLIAAIDGSAPTGAVLIAAHHDTVPSSPGAADDGAGVVVLLEVARRLAAEDRPRNDVRFLLTDGEELGMRGARAFLREHPAAEGVAAVINLEAAGGRGPAVLFGAGPDSGHVVAAFRDRPPLADSLSEAVFAAIPNNTDYAAFRERGIPGVNVALVDGAQRYHAPDDVPERVDARSLQHVGDVTLAAARRLAEADLRDRRPTGAFASFVGRRWSSWSSASARGLGVFAALVAAAWLARRRPVSGSPRAGAGALVAAVFAFAVVAGFALLADGVAVAVRGGAWLAPRGDAATATTALAAQLAAALALLPATRAFASGVVAVLLVPTAVSATVLPAAAHTLAIPLLALVAALWLTRPRPAAGPARELGASVVTPFALLVVTPVVFRIGLLTHVRAPFGAVGGAALAVAVALPIAPLTAGIGRRARRLVVATAFGALAISSAWG